MNVSYDLDTSGGLMPFIHALIKPPDGASDSMKTKKSQHPYYRRPGKGHNHDSCDACQEGGDLICCDRCPASFHLGCHDPPLEEADIPMGQWLCLECRSANDKRPTSPTTSHRSFEGNSSTSNSTTGPEKRSRSLRANRSNSAVSSASSSSRKNEREKDVESKETAAEPRPVPEKEPEKEEDLSPMEVLIRAARIMNPTQFQLPNEMKVYCPFPGTDKPLDRNGKQQPAALTKDANGLVPLPAKLCFHCGRSCRIAPLLQCDYCPLLFHQDCLDPPMTALPSGRWMCPNHVEQYIDWQLVNSVSATERIALWNKMTGPVDHHAVRIDFLRKCRGLRRPFRVRIAGPPLKGRVSVPAMVKHHYKKPPSLLPARRDIVRCKNVMKKYQKYTDSDEENDKKKSICMNLLCPRYLSNNAICDHNSSDSEDSLNDQEQCADEDLKAMAIEVEDSSAKRKSGVKTPNLDVPAEEKSPKRRKKDEAEVKKDLDLLDASIKAEAKQEKCDTQLTDTAGATDSKEVKSVITQIDEQMKNLDKDLVKLLAFQRLQQLVEGAPINSSGDLDDNVAELIKNSIDKSSLTKYGFKHIALPSELLNKIDLDRITKEVAGAVAPADEVGRLRHPPRSVPPTPQVKITAPAARPHHTQTPAALLPQTPTPSLSAMTVKATLCPIERPARNGLGDGLGRPVPMRLSRLLIGVGGGCDLQLQNYGHCNYVSEHHAIIFYDDVTHHFELVNYSEYGTVINGQIYSCDFSEKNAPPPAASNANAGAGTSVKEEPLPLSAEERAAGLKEVANKRRGTVDTKEKKRIPAVLCRCSSPPSDETLVSGWEGGAILHHGSLLQFGCLMFVFSITDFHTSTSGLVAPS